MRALIIASLASAAAVLVQGMAAVVAAGADGSITCSRWLDITTCSSAGGYVSPDWGRDGMRFGQDSDGDRWSTSRWQGRETTTVWSCPER
jgi:hypothetical protein